MRDLLAALSALIIFGAVAACAGPDDAASAMSRAGFSDVRITNTTYVAVEWEGCSKGDNAAFTASGINANRVRVTATVCCGTLKKCTIRY